jgi:hypothetical protein
MVTVVLEVASGDKSGRLNCCWSSPAQIMVLKPVVLMVIFNCDSGRRATLTLWIWQSQESKLLYDWRFTANQFALAPSPVRLTTSVLF